MLLITKSRTLRIVAFLILFKYLKKKPEIIFVSVAKKMVIFSKLSSNFFHLQYTLEIDFFFAKNSLWDNQKLVLFGLDFNFWSHFQSWKFFFLLTIEESEKYICFGQFLMTSPVLDENTGIDPKLFGLPSENACSSFNWKISQF